MTKYIFKRILLAAFTLLIIMAVTYVLLRLAPGDPSKASFLGENAAGSAGLASDKTSFARNKSMAEYLHLDDPIYVGFFLWMKNIAAHGDFGVSVSVDKGRPVLAIIAERLPVTLTLNFWAILITYLIAVPLGIFSAVTRHRKSDAGITFFLFFLFSLPVFWVALLLQALLCHGGVLPLFPLKGISPDSIDGTGTWMIMLKTAAYYVLPVFCLSYTGFAGLSRYARSCMLEVVRKDYIRTARAKGLPEYMVILKHALRNAMITMITLFSDLIPGLIAGSIIIEYVFNIPGMGDLSMQALGSRDIPLLMALFCFGSVLTLSGILLADILYVFADPRISFSGRR